MPVPLLHRHNRSVADLRSNLEFIHETLRARQADAHALAAGITVLHDLRDIGDAWSGIARHDFHAALRSVLEKRNGDFSMLRIFENVAAHFRNRGRNESGVTNGKARFNGNGAPL